MIKCKHCGRHLYVSGISQEYLHESETGLGYRRCVMDTFAEPEDEE